MPVAQLAAFVVGVCLLQWQAALPAWPVLLAGAAVGVALIFATIRTKLSARGATALACIAALILGFSHAGGRAQSTWCGPIMRVPRSGGLARAVTGSHAPGAPSRCATGTTAPAQGIPHRFWKATRKSREKGSLASRFSGCRRPKDWCTSC